ncbi:hypothetical protein [Streptomyces sp. TRM68367]|uniref:hypothetical protein n=1 Tax=Streptomyces sp. TRM68367 TaxID=2758415 RepID=UPI0019B4750F|nr:hypothetical protein [Streptomyces sp. TRM68367]MBC9730897.1 hypothetical protein [Streptomyces sp. TRM68367]
MPDGHPAHHAARTPKDHPETARDRRSEFTRWIQAQAESEAEKLSYVTYTKTNPETGEVYTGRSRGVGTPEEIVAGRDSGHHMNDKGFGPAVLDKFAEATKSVAERHSDPAYQAIRGREQQLIDFFGGAKSDGGISGNAIRGVAADNPLLGTFLNAATKMFGAP